jgi:hypothetical protein
MNVTHVPTTIQCVNLLLERVPELRPVYDKHVHDCDELLPYVFLGDVTRYVVQQIRLGETGPETPVERILGFLEQCMAFGDEHVKELVSVSFIENLLEHEDAPAGIKGLIGPTLEKEITNYGK